VSVGFVGRERELSRVEGALGGDARSVLVVGDAGVGKTRFAGECMRRAAAGGMVCALGGCLPLGGELPLLPVVDALGELSRLEGGRLLEAALGSVPGYVRTEVARLLPQLEAGDPGHGRVEGWQRERLFLAVAELLGAVAQESGLVVVVEDVHWADSATLDCLTYLARAAGADAVTLVVTCRGDEVPVGPPLAGWLAHVRSGGVEEIRLGPLSRDEVAQQIVALVGGEPPGGFADDLFARAEGNPFFTEQLVAAALAGPAGDVLRVPSLLPERLAGLLAARASGCGNAARAMLAGLAVAGRPLSETLLSEVARLDSEAVREGLRELVARLLAVSSSDGAYRPRHALLAQAVAAGLLPEERMVLHERTARALAATGDEMLAAEVARHWGAAGRAAEELPARVTAAGAAERVFGYAEAAVHLQRAIELCEAMLTDGSTVQAADIDVPRLYVRAVDALELSGDGERASELAQDAYRRFAHHPDPATAAVAHHRAAHFQSIEAPATGLPLIEEALRLFGQAPPSADHAEAWLDYGQRFLVHAEGRLDAGHAALERAVEIAEATGATALIARILPWLGSQAFDRGQIEEGFAIFQRGRTLAETSGDSTALLYLDINESDVLLKLARFDDAADVALRGLRAARQSGLPAWARAIVLACNASEALLAGGRTAEAAALIDPLITGPPGRDDWGIHECRSEIDLLEGDIEAATRRRQQFKPWADSAGSIEWARETSQRAADLAVWAGRPADAIEETKRVLALYTGPDLTIFSGRLLAIGMRACADLAEQARARRDGHAANAALAAATDLSSWVDQMAGAPFADHPFVGTIPAERAIWDAECSRLAGPSDPDAWSAAAKSWGSLGCPHLTGYARWRQAEAQLDAGLPPAVAAAALRAAAAAADGHAPLLAQIRALAQRARIPLDSPPDVIRAAPPDTATPYGLTGRELAVLRLVAAGRTNAQIGAELFISPRTAGVHVTNILRKLSVANRVQAAALAERAGLIPPPQA
jgi:DNA-binding CsgD family transcriptional regulator/tetratricopeptide (TPR) repeat protein